MKVDVDISAIKELEKKHRDIANELRDKYLAAEKMKEKALEQENLTNEYRARGLLDEDMYISTFHFLGHHFFVIHNNPDFPYSKGEADIKFFAPMWEGALIRVLESIKKIRGRSHK